MEKTKVAIVGLGTVGSGVAQLLLDHGDRTARHAGRILWLEQVVVRDLKKPRDCKLPSGLLSDDLTRITGNPEIKAVAHLLGGLEPARTIMLKLLESGKDVITANKALLAEHGPELFDRARELGRSIAFEASVAGGIPIVANISQCLSANQIESLAAILNGTSNFILTQMEEQDMPYDEAVCEAQRLGYAEADPTMDVDGTDTAQKLAILAHLAFGSRVPWNDIPRRGIDTLDVTDLRYAKELGYRIKLLAVARLDGSGLELHVSPTLVRIGTPLAEVRGAFNAIRVVGDAVGPLFFHGLGAGQMPTASAVVADMIDTVVGRTGITFRTLELWSQRDEGTVTARDHAKVRSRYYLRFHVDDRPGVLSEITGVLGKHGISIASVIQHEPSAPQTTVVPLVIMTHTTTEGATQGAVDEIDGLGCALGQRKNEYQRLMGKCELAMKYAIIIPDGCADEPQESLGGRTPLQAANVPNMDAIAAAGVVGRANNVPASLLPGSDVANLSLLGYDPLAHFTGRAPLEAAAQGIKLGPHDWAIRCNLVTVEQQTMRDFTAGHVSTEEATQLLATAQERLGSDRLQFMPGVSYRNLLIYRGEGLPPPFSQDTRATPPHDLTDKSVLDDYPRGPGSDLLNRLMSASVSIFADHPVNVARRQRGQLPATNVWLWGLGKTPSLEPFQQRYGKRGTMITEVDLLRGLAALIGWNRIEVPGTTGYYDTDYAAMGRYAIDAIDGTDIICVHVEATDEASHEGNAMAKIKALEDIDRHIVGPLHAALQKRGDYRILVSPDHPTPLRTKTHSHGLVPLAICGTGIKTDTSKTYDEPTAGASGLAFPDGWKMMGYFVGK